MTDPKQTAAKLIQMFEHEIETSDFYGGIETYDKSLYDETRKLSKSLAIIHVNGIIDELDDEVTGFTNDGGSYTTDNFRKLFWNDVLKEIEKM